ncbi:MAG: DUF1684 domain-containing protein [Bacteroidia bacterium]|nr:DUF1684 domain-containing protein [Bacteroidia bacterium]
MWSVRNTLFVLGFFLLACNESASKVELSPYVKQIVQERKEKDQYLVTNGILEEAYLEGFKGLQYFDVDSNYKVDAQIVFGPKLHKQINTSTNELRDYYVYCRLAFKINNHLDTLEAYTEDTLNPTYLFVPFKDKTTGNKSYQGGRFIELPYAGEQQKIEIDFNLAFNPYCHYSHNYSCPLVPFENILDIPIQAGEIKLHE